MNISAGLLITAPGFLSINISLFFDNVRLSGIIINHYILKEGIMNKSILIITIGLLVLVVSCGGVSADKFNKTWDRYIEKKLADLEAGSTGNELALQDEAARENGFENWIDFNQQSARSLKAEYQVLAQEKSAELGQKVSDLLVSKYNEEQ
jgi:hypothetical protein